MAQLLFTRRANLGAGFIRMVGWSGWSHVQVLRGETLWGASFPHGVEQEDFETRIRSSSHAALVTFPTLDVDGGTRFIFENKHKPYDIIGAIGLGIHREWEDPAAWWCSEYAAAFLEASGLILFREGAIKRITPQDLFKLNYPIQYLK